MNRVLAACAALCAFSFVGCSSLQVYHLGEDDNAPLVGAMPYYLPRGTINFSGSVVLNSCDLVTKNVPAPTIVIDAKASISIATATEPDPEYHYYISYEASRTWMKEINFTVTTNSNGTLQTLNSTINDQAGPDIVAAIGAAVQIGGAISLAGVGRPPQAPLVTTAEKLKKPINCNTLLRSDVMKTLTDIGDQKTAKDGITKRPAVGAAEAAAQAQALQAIQTKIDSDTKKLTRTFTYKWTPSRKDKNTVFGDYVVIQKEIAIKSLVEEWFTSDVGLPWLHDPAGQNDARAKLTAPYLASIAMLRSTMDRPVEPDLEPSEQSQPMNGLIVRDPANAVLRVCRAGQAGCAPQRAAQPDDMLVETTGDDNPRVALRLPQFGRLVVLTEESGLFENALLSVTLNSDGTIQTINYHATSTLATGLGGLGQAAGNASTAIAARNTAIAAKNTAEAAVTTAATAQIQAPDTYNKALADCLMQAAAITRAGLTPAPCQ